MDIANALADLLDDVDVPLKELVLEALYLYSKTKPDYAGCIYIAEAKTRNEHVLTFDKKMISGMKQMGIPEQGEKACRTDDNQKPFWIQKDQSINEPSTNCQANLSLHYKHLAYFTPLSVDSCQANSGRENLDCLMRIAG